MIMEDILRFCGYNSAYNLIKEEVERIAEKYFEWGDYEKAKADEDDAAYQRYRDGD